METPAHIQMLFRIATMEQECVDRKEQETDPEGCLFPETGGVIQEQGQKEGWTPSPSLALQHSVAPSAFTGQAGPLCFWLHLS